MTRLAHVVTGLGSGGAEGFLARLVPALRRHDIDGTVFSLTDDGVHGAALRDDGIDVCSMGLVPGRPDPRVILRLANHLHDVRPDAVMTWLYDADLVGGLSAVAARLPVVWNLRQTAPGPDAPARHRRVVHLNSFLSSRLPRRIVCNSSRVLSSHVALGFPAERMDVVRNGTDVGVFRPDQDARQDVRSELGVAPDAELIGHVARFDRLKDHRTLLRACAELMRQRSTVHLVACGLGVDDANPTLTRLIADAGVDASRVHLLGRRDDLPRIDAALDVAVSSSSDEGSSNALVEAMACGVPCVSTDTGDAADLIGDTGLIVPIENSIALAVALKDILDRGVPRTEAVRRRVIGRYDLESSTAAYAAWLGKVVVGAT